MKASLFAKPGVVIPVAIKKPELIMLIDVEVIAVLPSPQAPLDVQQWQLNPKVLSLVTDMRALAAAEGVGIKFFLIGKKADFDKGSIVYWQGDSESKAGVTIRVSLDLVLKLYCQLLGIDSFPAKNCIGFEADQRNRLKFSQDIFQNRVGERVLLKHTYCLSRDLTVLRAVANEGGGFGRLATLGQLERVNDQLVSALSSNKYAGVKVILDVDNTTFLRSVTHLCKKVIINPDLRLLVELKETECCALTARPFIDDQATFDAALKRISMLLPDINAKLHFYFCGVSNLVMNIKSDVDKKLSLTCVHQYDNIVAKFKILADFFMDISLNIESAMANRNFSKIIDLFINYFNELYEVHRLCDVLIKETQSNVSKNSATLNKQVRKFNLSGMIRSLNEAVFSVNFSLTGVAAAFQKEFQKVLHINEFSYTDFDKTKKRKIEVMFEMFKPYIEAKLKVLAMFIDDNLEEISAARERIAELAAKGVTLIVIQVYEDNELYGSFSIEQEREMMNAPLSALSVEKLDRKDQKHKENIKPDQNSGVVGAKAAAVAKAAAAAGAADARSFTH